MKRILVTGITGYIGSSVAVKLKARGYEIVGLVRKKTDLSRLEAQGMSGRLRTIHDEELPAALVAEVDAVIQTADSADDADTFDRLLADTLALQLIATATPIKPETNSDGGYSILLSNLLYINY